jgi:hypothetical protein
MSDKAIAKWQAEIEVLEAELPVAQQARRDHPYMYSGDYETRCASMRAARKLEAVVESIRNRIKYRENKIASVGEVLPVLKDVFGQVFAVGQRVAWSSSSRYSGATLGWVVGINPKMIRVAGTVSYLPDSYGTNIFPKALIVVDAIVEKLEKNDV